MKTLRFTTTCALGAALALTLGASMNEAAAQVDTTRREPTRPSAERQRVRKETTGQTSPTTGQPTSPMAPSTTGETTMMRRDTVYVGRSDTTVVQCNCAAATQAATGEVLPFKALRERLFGNGLYAGLGGGATIPVGDAYKAYNEGWGLNAVVGWDPKASPVGVRGTFAYTTLNGRAAGPQIRDPLGRVDVINDFGGSGVDAKQISALIDAKLRIPFGRFLGATSGVYALAGGGIHHFRDYNSTVFLTNQFYGRGINSFNNDVSLLNSSRNASESSTRFGLNAGLGASLGIGTAEVFAETRYERVFTEFRALNYMPVIIGVQIH
ncbi:hypothetical protein [Roseisolibacter agri]|uniref:Outer membrane protein beta-barrel domain-containing protein n=1 Tax=Roseisolibacter agri TaxID=2014610 RepID=A0AA37Q3Y9_9BACT|nr:hypothetical protein [Roseisolibacter agri]GLC24187.1 hypothetical protein rosag_07000 [Roseisolibacter agri]